MINSISEALDIIFEQNCSLDVATNNSELQETYYNSSETLTNSRPEKRKIHEKKISTLPLHLEIILEQNSMMSELTTINSAFQEIDNDSLKDGDNPLPIFVTQSLETTFTTDKTCSSELEEVIIVRIHICLQLINMVAKWKEMYL